MRRILLLLALLMPWCLGTEGPVPSHLRCEDLVDPLGIHEATPRLTWVAASSRRGARVDGLEVLVASSAERLAHDEGDCWASGRLPAGDGLGVVYAGRALASRQGCWWKVRLWDDTGTVGPWSAPARFEMGLLQPGDWQARWIGASLDLLWPGLTSLVRTPARWHAEAGIDPKQLRQQAPTGERCFRRHLRLPKAAVRAALSIAAEDPYAVVVDGTEVAVVTDTPRRPRLIDLTARATAGDHVVAVVVRHGTGAAGLWSRLVVQLPGGEPQLDAGDAWVSSADGKPAWTAAGAADQGWTKAVDLKSPLPDLVETYPAPLLRHAFAVADKPVARARLYATALGLMDFQVNGQRVGDHALAPEWTDTRIRSRYQVYDLTPLVRPGANAIGARLAQGWYSGHIGNGNFRHGGVWPALLAQVEVTYADGTTASFGSDATWRCASGPIVSTDFMLGERYDARQEVAGWAAPGFDDRDWTPVAERVVPVRPLDPQVMEPVRVLQELPARTVRESQPGRAVYDLGQNLVGVVRLRVTAPAGTTVTIRHAEMLNADGTLSTANYRGAPSIDTYTCRGGGEEVWQPAFTFHGFRYVELSGLPQTPGLGAVTALVIGSDTPTTGAFTCSDARLNQLQSNIRWGQRGNYLSIPTDCPQRDERLGWMGDAQVFVRTATGNADVAAFFAKWLVDVDDAQTPDGAFTDVSPRAGSSAGTPAWADAGVICPWEVYRAYGNRRLLERHYPAMARWVAWCRTHSEGHLRRKDRGADYGDWLSQGANTPKEVIGTAYYAHVTGIMAQVAEILGKTEDAAAFRQQRAEIVAAFNAAYVTPDGRIEGDTQCVYLMALRFGLLDPTRSAQAVTHLVNDITARKDHLSTGFVGVSYLLPVLSDHGQPDVAFRLLLQDTFPSWLFSVKHGATTIWERWDGWTPEKGFQNPSMNSFNHYALGSCGEWMYGGLAGLDQAPGSAGWQHLRIHPHLGGGLTSASYRLDTVRGPAASAWEVQDQATIVTCTVPVGATAEVVLPTTTATGVTEGDVRLTEAPGIRPAVAVAGSLTVTVGSGTYRFRIPRP